MKDNEATHFNSERRFWRYLSVAVVLLGIVASVTMFFWHSPHNISSRQTGLKRGITTEDVRRATRDFATVRPLRGNLGRPLADYEETADVNLDEKIANLLLDQRITRADKIKTLWAVFLDSNSSKENRVLVLDWLNLVQPIELTDALLAEFRSSTSTEEQGKILTLLSTALRIADSLETNTLSDESEFVASQSAKIQDLFKEIAKTGNNKELRRAAILAIPNILPTADLLEIFEQIQQEYRNNTSPITYDEMLGLWARAAFADSEAQKDLLPVLIDHMANSENAIQDPSVLAQFFTLIASGNLESNSKARLREYLTQNAPINTSPQISYLWLKAYGAVESRDESSHVELVEDYFQKGDPSLQAGILLNEEDLFMKKFDTDTLSKVTQAIGKEYLNQRQQGREISQFREALQLLAGQTEPSVAIQARNFLDAK
jgi:hypothetical protein